MAHYLKYHLQAKAHFPCYGYVIHIPTPPFFDRDNLEVRRRICGTS